MQSVRILNDVESLDRVIARGGESPESPEVVLGAIYGWYWAVDALRAAGANVHLAHLLGVRAFVYRRVKNDFRDAADLLRMGRLPEAWIAPPATRELRELVRHRAKLVGLRSHCKAEVHTVRAKCGVQVLVSDLFGMDGTALLDRLASPRCVGCWTIWSSRSTCSPAWSKVRSAPIPSNCPDAPR